jgi:hypothetical protein
VVFHFVSTTLFRTDATRPEKKKNPGSSSSSRRASSHQSIHNEQAHPQLPASTGEPTPDPALTDYPQRAAPITWLRAAPVTG